ncbi:MAG: DUF86 domain-containing protein [Gemmatimonadetes bacterium]|nr:DUF86 domain-containing protein [Gemmatimonadota bacterium]
MVRRDFIARKLRLIAEDLGRLAHFRDDSLETLTGDFLRMAAVERLLERIVMRAIDINEHLVGELSTGREERTTRLTYRDSFIRLAELSVYPAEFAERIARSAGLRNILVHDYNDVDRRIVHGSIRGCLEDYRRYVELVDGFVERRVGDA